MTNSAVRFDDSLPLLVDVVADEIGSAALSRGVVLRDATGRLTFFSAEELNPSLRDRLAGRLSEALGSYARPDRVLAASTDYGAKEVLEETGSLLLRVHEHSVRILDRRLAGADWLRTPAPPAGGPPRFVFASLKGGVGRSTALAVAAAHIAARGGRVLAVDLDLEAPGLGAFLLTDETVPEFGMIDALVENGLQALDSSFLSDLVGPCGLADRAGRIDVVPALGKRSLRNPGDVLAKLARAYAEDIQADGGVATILDQVREIIDRLADPGRYDVVLVDVRAGLHETTASAVLGLGAEVLLFGLDEPQTFQGYAALLAHLAHFVPAGGELPEWVDRLTAVHAKAATDAAERQEFKLTWRGLVEDSGLTGSARSMSEDWSEEDFQEVHWEEIEIDESDLVTESWIDQPIAVLRDVRYETFDPLRRRDLLSEEIYQATFGELVRFIEKAVFPSTQSDV